MLVACKECGSQISDAAPACPKCGKPRANPNANRKPIGLVGTIVLVVLGFAVLGQLLPGSGEAVKPAVQPLASDQVAGCGDEIAKAQRRGLIRQRPSNNRINVDEMKWALLPATEKTALLGLLACNTYGVQPGSLEPMQYVVAYGYRSGKRLALFGSTGVQWE